MKAIFFAIAGLALLIAAAITALGVHRFRNDATRTEGVVTRLNAGGSHPQIEFRTAAGDTVSYAQGGLIFGYSPGDRVAVMYRPAQPQGTARLDHPGAMWAMPLLLGAIGLGFGLGGIMEIMAARRQ